MELLVFVVVACLFCTVTYMIANMAIDDMIKESNSIFHKKINTVVNDINEAFTSIARDIKEMKAHTGSNQSRINIFENKINEKISALEKYFKIQFVNDIEKRDVPVGKIYEKKSNKKVHF